MYTHPGNLLGWSEYVWIPGYSDKRGGLECMCIPVLSQVPGFSDFLPCSRTVRVASVVGIAMTTTRTIMAGVTGHECGGDSNTGISSIWVGDIDIGHH